MRFHTPHGGMFAATLQKRLARVIQQLVDAEPVS